MAEMIENMIIFISGTTTGFIVAIFVLALCRAADEADRKAGYK